MGRWERRKSPDGKRASGGRPRSMTTSTSAGSSGWVSTRRLSSLGSSSRSRRSSSSSDPSGHAKPSASASAPPRTAQSGRPPRRWAKGRTARGQDAMEGEREAWRREGEIGWGGTRERRRRRWSGGGGGIGVGRGRSGRRDEWRESVCDGEPLFRFPFANTSLFDRDRSIG